MPNHLNEPETPDPALSLGRQAAQHAFMNIRCILLAAMFATEVLAADGVIARNVSVPGTPIYYHRTNSTYILNTNPVPSAIERRGFFRVQLVQFAVSPPSGSPTNYVISGKVADNNAGAPVERAEILFSSPGHRLRLAALTNADGEFKFRVLLREGEFGDTRLRTRNLDESVLYVSSQIGGYPDRDPRDGDTIAYAYSIRELLARDPVPQPMETK